MKYIKFDTKGNVDLKNFLMAYAEKKLKGWKKTIYSPVYELFYICPDTAEFGLAGTTSTIEREGETVTFELLLKLIDDLAKTAPIVIKLNSQYNAVISVDGNTVTVGCQTFTREQVLSVYEAMVKQSY